MLESVEVGKRSVADYEATAGRETVERLKELAEPLCAGKLLFLLRNPKEGAQLARAGREIVGERFLLTRLISDELELYADLIETTAGHGARSYEVGR